MQHYPPGCKEYPLKLVERHQPIDVLVYGHSHKPSVSLAHDGALRINPRQRRPKRFKLPRSLATLRYEGASRWTVAFLGLGDTASSDLPSPETYELGADGILTMSSSVGSIRDGGDHDGRSSGIEMAPQRKCDRTAAHQHQNEPRQSKRRRQQRHINN